MSDIHYFQRYSTKENSVTNTVLHLFARIYEHSPKRLRVLLNEIVDDDIPIGISFAQQVRSSGSVPDGSIQQSPVKIMIETKVDAGVNVSQLKNHLANMGGGEYHYLLLLTRDPVADSTLTPVVAAATAAGVGFVHRTFDQLCEYLDGKVEEHEIHLKPVVEDFTAYCDEMGLRQDRRVWLRVVPCGKSHALNRKYGIYFHPQNRPYHGHGILGIYWGKSVRLIGGVKSVYDVNLVSGVFTKTLFQGAATDEFDDKIKGMIAETLPQTGWDVSTGHRFYCTPGFIETDYVKASSYGIQGSRKLDVTAYYPAGTTLAELAAKLRTVKWDASED